LSSLEELLTHVAGEVGATSAAGEFKREGRLFAVVAGNAVEVRLDPEVAEAALNTPATTASKRGADWVRLTVAPDAPHDLDRARAWFLSGFRNAERG
jgi:hypothetical protein